MLEFQKKCFSFFGVAVSEYKRMEADFTTTTLEQNR